MESLPHPHPPTSNNWKLDQTRETIVFGHWTAILRGETRVGEHHDSQIPQRKLLVAHPVGASVGWALAWGEGARIQARRGLPVGGPGPGMHLQEGNTLSLGPKVRDAGSSPQDWVRPSPPSLQGGPRASASPPCAPQHGRLQPPPPHSGGVLLSLAVTWAAAH